MDETLTKAQLSQKAVYEKEKGNQHFKKGNYSAAYDHYSRAVCCNAGQPVFWCNRAMTLIKLRRFEEAVQDCDAAIQLDQTYVKAHYRRGLALKLCNRTMDAKLAFDQVLLHDSGNKDALKEIQHLKYQAEYSETIINPVKTSANETKPDARKPLHKIPVEMIGSPPLVASSALSPQPRPADRDLTMVPTMTGDFGKTGNFGGMDCRPETAIQPKLSLISEIQNADDSVNDDYLMETSSQSSSARPSNIKSPTNFLEDPHGAETAVLALSKKPDLQQRPGPDLSSAPFRADFQGNLGSSVTSSNSTSHHHSSKLEVENKYPGGISPGDPKSDHAISEGCLGSAVSPSLPGVPETAYQFMVDWQLLRNCQELFAEYLMKIPCSCFPSLMKYSLESDVLSSILESVAKYHEKYPQYDLAHFLDNLTQVPRWRTMFMLADSRDKANIETVISSIPEDHVKRATIRGLCS